MLGLKLNHVSKNRTQVFDLFAENKLDYGSDEFYNYAFLCLITLKYKNGLAKVPLELKYEWVIISDGFIDG